jgi:hypothetical protein
VQYFVNHTCFTDIWIFKITFHNPFREGIIRLEFEKMLKEGGFTNSKKTDNYLIFPPTVKLINIPNDNT